MIRIAGIMSCIIVVAMASVAWGQSLEERLDEDQFMAGLIDLHLPEVLDAYLADHPTSDPVQRRVREIARLRMTLTDPHVSEARHEEITMHIGHALEAMVSDHPADPRQGAWLAQHVSDLLLGVLPIEGSDLVALYGVPSPGQLDRARRVAARAHALIEEASTAIRDGLRELESSDDGSAHRRRLIGRLAHDERDQRIPLMRGIASVLHAEFNERDRQRRAGLYAVARDELSRIDRSVEGRARVLARLYHGLAMVRLGEFNIAETDFRDVASDPDASPADIFAARMGGVLNRETNRGPEAALEGLDDVAANYGTDAALFYRLVIADRRFLLRRRIAMMGPPAQQANGLAAAFDAYLDLLDEGGEDDGYLRSLVDERLSRVADVDVPPEKMPTAMLVATARRLVQDERTVDEGISLLQNALRREPIADHHRAEAMYELGRAYMQRDEYERASVLFLRLADELPHDTRAPEAVELGTALALHVARTHPTDAEARQSARRALELLLGKYGDIRGVDRWQYESAVLAMEDRRLDEADAFIDRIGVGSDQWLNSRLLWIQVARRRMLAADIASDRHRTAAETLRRIGQVSTTVRGAQVGSSESSTLALLGVFEAEASLASGDPERAIELLDALHDTTSLDESIFIIAMRVKVEAYRRVDRPGEVVADVVALRERSPEWARSIAGGLLQTLRDEAASMAREGQELEAAAFAEREMVELARALEEMIDGRSPGGEEILAIADAFRFAMQHDAALAMYERLPDDYGQSVLGLIGRAESLFGLGGDDLGEAMRLYKRIAGGDRAVVGDAYWLAQLRVLQILDRADRNTHKIVPRIQQLRYEDPDLGTPQSRRGIERLDRKYRDA